VPFAKICPSANASLIHGILNGMLLYMLINGMLSFAARRTATLYCTDGAMVMFKSEVSGEINLVRSGIATGGIDGNHDTETNGYMFSSNLVDREIDIALDVGILTLNFQKDPHCPTVITDDEENLVYTYIYASNTDGNAVAINLADGADLTIGNTTGSIVSLTEAHQNDIKNLVVVMRAPGGSIGSASNCAAPVW
jgi:hypothetical protein